MYVAEVVNNFGLEDDPGAEVIYNILYKALNTISNAETKVEIMLAVIKFQLKIMHECGFGVELNTCLCCHASVKEETMFLVPELGGIVCKDCAQKLYYKKKQMPYRLRDFFNQMLVNDFDVVTDYEVKANEKVCEVSFNVLKEYIELKSPKKFQSTSIEQLA
jgi:DNA repair protein RecO (recombination protein O)